MVWGHSELVTEVYEHHLPIGRSNGDVEYFLRHLASVPGPVLEAAVGTGRVLIPLAEAGLAMEGLDHSPSMVDRCRANCFERGLSPILHVADMASFKQAERYAAVVVAAGSIRNLNDRNQARATLANIHASLAPGGLALIDVIAPRAEVAPGPVHNWERGDTIWTVQRVALREEPNESRCLELLRYEKWRSGELIAQELHRYVLLRWSLQEFHDLLTETGFVDIMVDADHVDGVHPDAGTADWSFRARRS